MKEVEAAQFLGEGGLTCGELAGSEETPSGAPLSRDSQEGTVVCPRFPRITRSGWYPRLARPLAATPGTPPAEFSVICVSCLGRAGSCPRRCLRTSTKTNYPQRSSPRRSLCSLTLENTGQCDRRFYTPLPCPSISLLSPALTYPFLPLLLYTPSHP